MVQKGTAVNLSIDYAFVPRKRVKVRSETLRAEIRHPSKKRNEDDQKEGAEHKKRSKGHAVMNKEEERGARTVKSVKGPKSPQSGSTKKMGRRQRRS